MRALIVEDQNKIALRDIPEPVLKPDEILCRVTYSGICGTDLVIYSGETNFVRDGLIKYPVRIGHEWSGRVERVGAAVTKFKPGDRVVSDNGVSCRECEMCKSGRPELCENMRSVGTINCWEGSFADFIVMPECHLYHLPDSISDVNGATIEPLTVAYAGMTKYEITPKTIVAVIGTGAIGLAAMALAKCMGAGQIISIGRTDSKLELSKKVGATDTVNNTKVDAEQAVKSLTGGHGADFVVETSGAAPTVQQAIDIAAQHGFLSMIGFYEEPLQNLDFNRLVFKQLSVKGIMGELGLVPKIINYMEKTGLSLEDMITRVIPLEDAPDYFKRHKEMHHKDIKVLVKIN
jgi:Threonine dehydrogenase and related Zn-dependent dehydrogenases